MDDKRNKFEGDGADLRMRRLWSTNLEPHITFSPGLFGFQWKYLIEEKKTKCAMSKIGVVGGSCR